eukprot:317992-Prorocentrum_minimum.AAC.1
MERLRKEWRERKEGEGEGEGEGEASGGENSQLLQQLRKLLPERTFEEACEVRLAEQEDSVGHLSQSSCTHSGAVARFSSMILAAVGGVLRPRTASGDLKRTTTDIDIKLAKSLTTRRDASGNLVLSPIDA